ncbi:ligand-dependent nuclear receptor-interacting factor 1 isoform X2 [Pleurodeles waltl]|uniref:ligand-dependent nuclear receptor-interacting factor 1 isoform X2 n=1 Tax=Pleurodeles waltl TaxID=8319 RepID=UPI0037097478
MSQFRQAGAPPPEAPPTAPDSAQSIAVGGIYKIINTSVLEGKNVLKLVPVSTSSVTTSSANASISSPQSASLNVPFSSITTVPLVHVPIVQHLNTGRSILASQTDHPGLVHNIAIECSTSSLHGTTVPVDKPLMHQRTVPLPLSAKPGDVPCMAVKPNNLPGTMSYPVLSSGHQLQIPANAEVKTVSASSLPHAVQQKILATAAASASGAQCSRMPSVIYMSPVNTVKTDTTKRLPTLYPKPQILHSAPLIYAQPQDPKGCSTTDVKSSNSEVCQGSPMKWVVHDTLQPESQCLVPVKSSNSIASRILKSLTDMKAAENISANVIPLCPTSTSTTTASITPVKENALVMYNGKFYLLAKKGMDVFSNECEKTSSSNIKTPDKPTEGALTADSVNNISNKVVDMVLSKNRNPPPPAGSMQTCINSEVSSQLKAKETPVPAQGVAIPGNKDNHPRIVSTIKINTNGKCSIKSSCSENSENSTLAINECVTPEKNDPLKNLSSRSDTPVSLNGEVIMECEPEMREKNISNLSDNLGKTQINKSEENTPKDSKITSIVQPILYQAASDLSKHVNASLQIVVSKKMEMEDNVDSAARPVTKDTFTPGEHDKTTITPLPVVHQAASIEPSKLQKATSNLKLVVSKERKPQSGDVSTPGILERSSSAEEGPSNVNVENTNVHVPILDQTSVNLDVQDQRSVVGPLKRKFKLMDNIVKPKRKHVLESYTLNNNVVSDSMGPNNSQQVDDHVKLKVYKKRKSKHHNITNTKRNESDTACTLIKDSEINSTRLSVDECDVHEESSASISLQSLQEPLSPRLDFLEVEQASSPSTSPVREEPDRSPSPETWRSTAWSSEKPVASSSKCLPVLQCEIDETIREERIRRLKDLLKEREQAVEAIRKTMLNV